MGFSAVDSLEKQVQISLNIERLEVAVSSRHPSLRNCAMQNRPHGRH
ncbi:hypothetical protein FQN60_010484 [Etheostoma spectabile]|uniref:Uncharacterized protein n=1 Tax=Etheostoma spectabile TaxID=54343 RepID=A0A5J5D6S5_9PERO|nr:hypothetical protein FQN60_010484 [Etheostoma spectabile]